MNRLKHRQRGLTTALSLSFDDEVNSGSGGGGGGGGIGVVGSLRLGQKGNKVGVSINSDAQSTIGRNQNDYNEGVVRSVKKRRSPVGDVWVNEFKRVGKLGKGSYGEVFKVSALSFSRYLLCLLSKISLYALVVQ